MLFNELAQWAAIVFLGIMTLGLTRQLGRFLTSNQQILTDSGPEVGSSLVGRLQDEDVHAISSLVAGGPVSQGAILVTDQSCFGCRQLLDMLNHERAADHLPLVAIVKRSGPEFRSEVADVADHVVADDDGELTSGLGIFGTPYLMVVDADLNVLHRELPSDADIAFALLTRGTAIDRPVGPATELASAGTQPITVSNYDGARGSVREEGVSTWHSES
jgi:hypothetical protein